MVREEESHYGDVGATSPTALIGAHSFMAKSRQLKVFRTPIGFHDAYVAAPSQKAALEAWGSDHNLFARGEAERIEDPKLTAEPLAHPGQVIKRLRGTAEEQFAALPPAKPRKGGAADKPPEEPSARKRRVPRPDRSSLDRAEEAVAAAERRHATALDAIAREEEKLRQRRRAAEKARDAELDKLRDRATRARASYERKLETWRG